MLDGEPVLRDNVPTNETIDWPADGEGRTAIARELLEAVVADPKEAARLSQSLAAVLAGRLAGITGPATIVYADVRAFVLADWRAHGVDVVE